MKSILLLNDWTISRMDNTWSGKKISIPFDAMLLDERTLDSMGGPNISWIDCKDYVFERTLTIGNELKGKTLVLEFEGVYHNAEVFLNDELVAKRPYGYTNFYVDITDKVNYGADNLIKVNAYNSDQPNSRFHSGTGIYRPVSLHVLDEKRIELNGIKLKTLNYETREVEVKIKTSCSGELKYKFSYKGETILEKTVFTNGEYIENVILEGAPLWNVDTPNLLDVEVEFYEDKQSLRFGVRQIEVSAEYGLKINGVKTLIQGACLHHDNGMIGAASYRAASYRKVRLMKENGYNAIRSAHNPCSKAVLDACDELGVLMMDEYVDMWYIHKLKYDYAGYCLDWWKEDLRDMIDKDYNHPSVVFISTGNEVGESASQKGIDFCKDMKNYIDINGAGWPVTCGIKVFFNALVAMGMGVYSDKKADKKQAVGSEFFNNLAGIFGDKTMKYGATLPIVDRKTKGVFEVLDVSGYNYGIARYKHDAKKYKDRVILGSETFCKDAAEFMRLAKKYPQVIGDFVWAGMDYLGEVGIGSWEYKEYAETFSKGLGWISAGSGRIDLAGNPLGEAKYTKVAFGYNAIDLAVRPVSHTGEKHSPSAWKMSNAIPSWSWNGLDGHKADVEVYSLAHKVELFLNGKSLGKKKTTKIGSTMFRVKYHDGELKAVAYDKTGAVVGEAMLKTAGDENKITLTPEYIGEGYKDLHYIHIDITDSNGVFKPLAKDKISVEVEGGELLALGHACPFNKDGYLNNWTSTYYGRALAIIKPISDKVVIKAKSELYGESELEIR